MAKSKYLSLFLFLLFFGCISKYEPPFAIGKATEIIVLCNNETWGEIDTLISDIFEQEIHTPTTEKIFDIKVVLLSEINNFRYRKNCLVLGVLGDEVIDSLLAKSAMKKLMEGENYFFGGQDLFIKGQYVLIVSAPTIHKLKEIIRANKEFIFNCYIDNVRRIIKDELYKDGYQEQLSDRLLKNYGFSISVPKGWIIVKEGMGFVEFIRHSPDRIISIQWETSPLDLSKSGESGLNKHVAIEMRNNIGHKYYDGDYVDTTLTSFFPVDFKAGIRAGKLIGIWQNDEQVMGGPFRSYVFSKDGKIYMIDMHVFAPGMKKWKHLEQLETIAETFKF